MEIKVIRKATDNGKIFNRVAIGGTYRHISVNLSNCTFFIGVHSLEIASALRQNRYRCTPDTLFQ